jgi:mannonate dehydratase
MNNDTTASRRGFLQAAALAASAAPATAAGRPLEPLSPGIKLTLQLPTSFKDDDLTFARQLGVKFIAVGTTGGTYEMFSGFRQRIEAAGLQVSNMGNTRVHNMPEVTLNLPGRDQKIEEYKQYLRNLGKAGIRYTTYAHMGNGIWSSDRETTRGGAPARAFKQETAKGVWSGRHSPDPSRTAAGSRRKRSGRTTPTSSAR